MKQDTLSNILLLVMKCNLTVTIQNRILEIISPSLCKLQN